MDNIIHYRPEIEGLTGFPIPSHFKQCIVFINGLISIENSDYCIVDNKVYPKYIKLCTDNVISILNADKAITKNDIQSLNEVILDCALATVFKVIDT